MSEIDKDLQEQINLIRADAESIEVSENVSFDNMMAKLNESQNGDKVCYFEESRHKSNKGIHDKKTNWVAMWTGVAGAVVAAVLMIALLIGDIANISCLNTQNNDGKEPQQCGIIDEYASKMKVEAGNGIYVLSGYKELDEFLSASKDMYSSNGKYWGNGLYGDVLEGDVAVDDFAPGDLNESATGAVDDEKTEVDSKPSSGSIDDDGNNAGSDADADYSDTNVRTEGVHEADIVKTDGKYIYYLRYNNDIKDNKVSLSVVQADGSDSRLLAQVDIEEAIKEALLNCDEYKNINTDIHLSMSGVELLICDDKLVVVVTPTVYLINSYEYENYVHTTVVLTYDMEDKSNPKLYSKLTFEGEYDSCKMVDGYVYIFAKLRKSAFITGKANTEEVAAQLYAPKINGDLLPSDDVYVAECTNYNAYNIIAVMDSEDMSKFYDVKAVIGASGSLDRYVSGNNIYFISNIGYDYLNIEKYGEEGTPIELAYQSQIMRFSYDKGVIEPTGCVNVNGDIGDEFDIDEYNGYLRMAVSAKYQTIKYQTIKYQPVKYQEVTTKYEVMTYEDMTPEYEEKIWADMSYNSYDYYITDTRAMSSLYIYDSNLQLVGSISELQKEEEVYGVRFDGDIAYIVTYRQTDPLFTVDLSDPTNPTVMGALKIPGFSTYLHKWDDNKLIGLGYDEYGQIKISSYDITNKYDVKEIEVCTLDSSYCSEVLYEHKAVFISSEKNLIGFAAEGYVIDSISGDGKFKMLYRIFSYVEGELTEVITCDMGKDYYSMRGLYIGDYIYIVNPGNGVTVYSMSDYAQVAYIG